MQNNWGVLILLVAAVLIYAVVQSLRKPKDDDESAEAPEGNRKEGPEAPAEPEQDELTWEVCQQQLSEELPIIEGEPVEFLPTADESLAPEAEVKPVPLSRHAMNSAIRREAWRLFRENYWRILPLAAIVVLLGALKPLFQAKWILPDWMIRGFNPVQEIFTALIAPVVTLGAAYAAVRLWKGETPRVRMLGFFLREGQYFHALGLMLLEMLVTIAPAALLGGALLLAGKIYQSAADTSWMGLTLARLAYAALFLCIAVYVWLAAWLEMVNYQMARAPERGAIAAFKVGFRTGNRHFGRVLGMTIATFWPYGVFAVAMMFGSMWDRVYQTRWFSRAGTILGFALTLFYGGYLMLSMAGLTEALLPEGRESPEKGEPDESGSNPGVAPRCAPMPGDRPRM